LMPVVAAAIIGGTSMKGGRGSVVETAVAVLMLVGLINGLGCMGAGFEVQQIASGGVLAVVVIYDAWRVAREAAARSAESAVSRVGRYCAGARIVDG
jgi:ribose transport system permease protein